MSWWSVLRLSGGVDASSSKKEWREWIPETNVSSHVANICSRKAHRPASNPRRLKAESRQFFIDLQQSHDHTQYPVIQILDTSTLSCVSMMQPSCRADGACCSQGPQASGMNWILRF